MHAFGIKPTPFHFGLLLNITYRCGLGSSKSMHDLLFPSQLLQFLPEVETNDSKEETHHEPSFFSSIDISNEEHSHLISTSNNLNVTNNHSQQLTSISSEVIENQISSISSELTSEWWQDPEDVRQGCLLKNHLRPFSNANILKPNISYQESNLVDLRMPRSPAERLMLLGGIPGVLKHMQECNIVPNNIIFNTFLNVN